MADTLDTVSSEYDILTDIRQTIKDESKRNHLFVDRLTSLRSNFNKLAESDKTSDRGKELDAAITELTNEYYDTTVDPHDLGEGEEDETEGAVAGGAAAGGAAAGGAGKGKRKSRKSRKSRNQRKRRSHTRRKYRRAVKS